MSLNQNVSATQIYLSNKDIRTQLSKLAKYIKKETSKPYTTVVNEIAKIFGYAHYNQLLEKHSHHTSLQQNVNEQVLTEGLLSLILTHKDNVHVLMKIKQILSGFDFIKYSRNATLGISTVTIVSDYIAQYKDSFYFKLIHLSNIAIDCQQLLWYAHSEQVGIHLFTLPISVQAQEYNNVFKHDNLIIQNMMALHNYESHLLTQRTNDSVFLMITSKDIHHLENVNIPYTKEHEIHFHQRTDVLSQLIKETQQFTYLDIADNTPILKHFAPYKDIESQDKTEIDTFDVISVSASKNQLKQRSSHLSIYAHSKNQLLEKELEYQVTFGSTFDECFSQEQKKRVCSAFELIASHHDSSFLHQLVHSLTNKVMPIVKRQECSFMLSIYQAIANQCQRINAKEVVSKVSSNTYSINILGLDNKLLDFSLITGSYYTQYNQQVITGVVGCCGSGKSHVINEMIYGYINRHRQGFIIDNGGSYQRLSQLMQATYIHIDETMSHCNVDLFQYMTPLNLKSDSCTYTDEQIFTLMKYIERISDNFDDIKTHCYNLLHVRTFSSLRELMSEVNLSIKKTFKGLIESTDKLDLSTCFIVFDFCNRFHLNEKDCVGVIEVLYLFMSLFKERFVILDETYHYADSQFSLIKNQQIMYTNQSIKDLKKIDKAMPHPIDQCILLQIKRKELESLSKDSDLYLDQILIKYQECIKQSRVINSLHEGNHFCLIKMNTHTLTKTKEHHRLISMYLPGSLMLKTKIYRMGVPLSKVQELHELLNQVELTFTQCDNILTSLHQSIHNYLNDQ